MAAQSLPAILCVNTGRFTLLSGVAWDDAGEDFLLPCCRGQRQVHFLQQHVPDAVESDRAACAALQALTEVFGGWPPQVERECSGPAVKLSCTAMQALAEATGKSPAQIKKMYEQEGDLGVVAATARSKQNTLFKPTALTLRAVFKCVHRLPAGDRCHLPKFQRTALCAFSTLIDTLAAIRVLGSWHAAHLGCIWGSRVCMAVSCEGAASDHCAIPHSCVAVHQSADLFPACCRTFQLIATTEGHKSQDKKKGHIVKLLAASKDNEAGYIMRALQVSCMCTSHPHAAARWEQAAGCRRE